MIKTTYYGALFGVLLLALGVAPSSAIGVDSSAGRGPILWYDFENVENGIARDRSGAGRDGALHGVGAQIGVGKTGAGLVLNENASDGYVEIPSNAVAQLSDASVLLWTRLPSFTAYGRLFDFGMNERANMYLAPSTTGSDAGKMQFAITTASTPGEQRVCVPTQFPLDEWIHVAAVQRGAKLELYLNGRLAAFQYGADHKLATILGEGARCYIGKSQYAHDANLRGSLDDFRIYDRALEQSAILDVMAESCPDARVLSTIEVSTPFGVAPTLPRAIELEDADGARRVSGVVWEITDQTAQSSRDYELIGRAGAWEKARARVKVVSDSLTPGLSIRCDGGAAWNNLHDVYGEFCVANDTAEPVDLNFVMEFFDRSGAQLGVTNESARVESGGFLRRKLERILDDAISPRSTTVKLCATDANGKPLAKSFVFTPRGIKSGDMIADSDVDLLPGLFKTMRDDNEVNLLSLDLDRLCASHFIASGLEPKAERYGGWESWDSSGFGVGHWLSAAALMYQKTGNCEYLDKMNYVVSELSQTQRASGFLGGLDEKRVIANIFDRPTDFEANEYQLGGIWDCWYGVQKVFKGLIEVHRSTGNERALEMATRFVHWLKGQTDKLTYEETQRMLFTEHGGVSESALWLYQITGDPDAFEVAKRFLRAGLLEPLALGEDNLTGRHVNEHVPEVQNAATYYEFSGDEKYRRAAEFFWDVCRDRRMYANSGMGTAEHYTAPDVEPLTSTNTETCCNFNMMKLTETLYTWNHDVKYIDYLEESLFNLIYPSQDQDNHAGYGKCYFASFLPGSYRFFSTRDDSFWCCCLGGMENPARLDKMIYYKDGDSFYVNLFIPSKATWREKGVSLKQETNFPYEPRSVVTITEGEAVGAIRVRAPGWLAAPATIRVNGEVVDVAPVDGYVEIDRTWRQGDEIEIETPMALNSYVSRDGLTAFRYGPILLAAVLDPVPDEERYSTNNNKLGAFAGLPSPTLKVDSADPNAFVKPVDLARLTFQIGPETTSDDSTLTFRPFFELNRNRYTVYWRVETN
ncbi:MAG: glycoside hydrolase family 127 protein [Thermoguttaceae bacterium]|nr:glycoside hydrolase family 127 protein [Thermoguttaceae bacterium]